MGTTTQPAIEGRDTMIVERLTPSEERVARLLAESNQDIAARLCISLRTVEFHVGNIFSKLGAANRTAALCRYMALLSSQEREALQNEIFVLPEGWKPPARPR